MPNIPGYFKHESDELVSDPVTGAPTAVMHKPDGTRVATLLGGATAPAAPTAIGASRALTAADDGARYYATAAITLTIPAGLVPRPECVVIPPPTGNLTIAVSGGANINGAATAITRTRAANPLGVAISPWPDVADNYGVSGA